jgi:hypothetical protein
MTPATSDQRAIISVMYEDEGENAARLAGLLAMLALPMVRTIDGRERRRTIEIEIKPGLWARVEGCTIERTRLIFWTGSNGTRMQYEFRASDGCPRWRADRPGQHNDLIDDEDPRPRDVR